MQLEAALAALNGAVSAAVACLASRTGVQTAKMLVGGAAGLALAVAVCCVAACCRVACVAFRPGPVPSQKQDDASLPRVDDDDDSQHRDPHVEAARSGGYRSDSSSDDEGQGERVAKLAQKRAHRSNGV
jgi:hypothetical protein